MSTAHPTNSGGAAHDALAASFAADPRVFYNKVSGTWQFEDDDGKDMEWDVSKGAWVPLLDEEMVKAQQAAYRVEGVDEDAVAQPVLKREAKKRKNDNMEVDSDVNLSISRTGKKTKAARPIAGASALGQPAPARASKNTAIYVSRLPLDTTVDELQESFGKFGVIEIDDEEQPKIKLYPDANGQFSGEALVVYFKEESVDLAIRMLDDAELRLGDTSTRMAVRKADFAHKPKDPIQAAAQVAPQDNKPRVVDRKKATRRIGKMQSKLNDWDDEDGFGPSSEVPETASSLALKGRVVVLKHMFTLKDLEDDATLLIELKNDVREECETLGDVTNVVLYDLEPDGVMTIKFRDAVSAQACILKMNGRFFDGRKVSASLYTGQEKFRKTGGGMGLLDDEQSEADRKRLDSFASWLEGKEP